MKSIIIKVLVGILIAVVVLYFVLMLTRTW